MSLSRPIPALLALAALLPAADQAPVAPTIDDKVKALEQQVKLLIRKGEVAEEVAKAADDKAKALVKDSDLVFKWKFYTQARATAAANATDNRGSGQDYYASSAANGSESEALRLSLRRVRLTVEARSKNDYFALATLKADGIGTSGTGNTNSASTLLHQAYIGKTFGAADNYQHEVKFGLDKAFNSESTISNSNQLLAADRAVGTILGSQREIGIAYQFRTPFLRAGLDIQDNANLSRNASEPTPVGNNANSNTGNYGGKPTPFTSIRIEGSPGADYLPAKKAESFVGAYGTEILFGFDYQNSGRTYAVSNESRQYHIFGPDVLVHWDNLTFLAEYRASHLGRSATEGSFAADEIDGLNGRHWDAQAGYVLPLDLPFKIEPALRLSVIDWATDIEEQSRWGVNSSRDNNTINPGSLLSQGSLTKGAIQGGSTNLGSGNEIDLGVNFYWSGHTNKTQLTYQSWKAEAGDGAAQAVIVQHQVTF